MRFTKQKIPLPSTRQRDFSISIEILLQIGIMKSRGEMMGLFSIFKKKESKTHNRNIQKEAEEAGYQAYMDFAKGSLTPEEAYLSRGFVNDEDGKWVYGKLVTINDTVKPKEKPCEPIGIKNTIIKEIKPANGAAFSFEKTAIIIEIVQAEGKEFVRIIDYDCCSGANGRPLYSLFEYYYKTDDVELTNISATNYKSKIKGNAEYQYKEFDCGVRY